MNVNEYFSDMKHFRNKIIVISAKDSASNYINRCHMREALHLEMHVGQRNSYVAVVDNKRGFVWENASPTGQDCSYKVGRRYIDIISCGYDSGNRSSIKIGDREFSHDRRGLNVAVFHCRTLELVDSFFVDTHDDGSLAVRRK